MVPGFGAVGRDVNPWSRQATSLTGRFSRLAANAMIPVRGVIAPFEPKAPPT